MHLLTWIHRKTLWPRFMLVDCRQLTTMHSLIDRWKESLFLSWLRGKSTQMLTSDLHRTVLPKQWKKKSQSFVKSCIQKLYVIDIRHCQNKVVTYHEFLLFINVYSALKTIYILEYKFRVTPYCNCCQNVFFNVVKRFGLSFQMWMNA